MDFNTLSQNIVNSIESSNLESINTEKISSIIASIDIKLVVCVIVGIVVIASVLKIIKAIKRKIRRTVSKAKRRFSDISQMTNMLKQVTEAMDDVVEVKSVGGSTSLYLNKIQQNFPDFHNSDAEAAIKTFITEYLAIRSGAQKDFTKANVNDKISLDLSKNINGKVFNIRFNNITIYNYTKTRDYATIKYRVSVGYDVNSKRVETRYEVDYSLQLTNSDAASTAMMCPNCGGAYESTNDYSCPYCGAKIIRDTILSWSVTHVKEY